ncbi:pyrroline-5-carboxylate reductase [Pseudodesulfovibrio thermohalotolerans]|uniref:pyrroline-5-carboxylate reductase n=1 Tax=Pseudodesulfovibrio thermohalotolerans TaxID=2880651 RepID=UPI0022B9E085|nr:pyrroline-5-carboxylate reductase [Pseudodesulfovibrio thermohalotolerans]WFS63123.1 pyrroline-5-carboxylate reductase [Pseudodesulfovibrio thermohalotolerans]
MNIGFIGTGNMGGAVIRTLKDVEGVTVYGVNRTRSKLDALAAETGLVPCGGVRELAEKADCIVLAVKPQQAGHIWPELTPALTGDKCLVSIAAGLTLDDLAGRVNHVCPVVRAMPNTPALIGEGVTAVCFDDPGLTDGQKQAVQELFQYSGDVHVLPESQFDVFTAVIGSGPAFIFYLIETMIESGVELGLEREASSRMVKKLFRGASLMAEQSSEHVSMLKEMSIAPAGTTIAALAHFDRTAVRGNIMDAIRMAYARSVELGG